jgi:hypothetical protein
MPVVPLRVATQGLLHSPLAVAAVRGRLTLDAQVIVDELHGGNSSKLRLLMPDEKLDRLLKREDEEILAIIIAFMENLDE